MAINPNSKSASISHNGITSGKAEGDFNQRHFSTDEVDELLLEAIIAGRKMGLERISAFYEQLANDNRAALDGGSNDESDGYDTKSVIWAYERVGLAASLVQFSDVCADEEIALAESIIADFERSKDRKFSSERAHD